MANFFKNKFVFHYFCVKMVFTFVLEIFFEARRSISNEINHLKYFQKGQTRSPNRSISLCKKVTVTVAQMY